MSNQIIQNYLNDTSISIEKRKKVIDAIKSGNADETKIASAISQKFGDKYVPRQNMNDSESAIEKGVEEKSSLRKTLDPIGAGIMGAVGGTYQAAGNIANAALKGLSYLPGTSQYGAYQAEKIGQAIESETEQGASFISETSKKAFGKQEVASSIGEFGGSLLPSIAVGGALAKSLPVATSLAPKIFNAIANSVSSTAVSTASLSGELPTLTDLSIGGVIDATTYGMGKGLNKLGGSIYKKAFRATKGEEKTLVQQFGVTAGDIAEEFGFTGKPASIVNKAQNELSNTWANLVGKARSVGKIQPSQFDDLAENLARKMTDGLPDSQYKSELLDTIRESVIQFKPKEAIGGDQVVRMISEINEDLFKSGQRLVLPNNVANSLAAKTRDGLKSMLPAEIKPLYKKYAKLKVVEGVMQDSEVKRIVARVWAGAWNGSLLGGIGMAASGQYTPVEIAKNALIFGIIGGIGARATANTAILTNLGKSLKGASNFAISPEANQLAKISALKTVDWINKSEY